MVSLPVVMCRYADGRLERHKVHIQETQYVAISHVWEEAQWLHVPGIDGDVLVSPEKARFMAESLPSIIGAAWFWMDILCVDQRDKTARIAVTQQIPTIFRLAQRTVMIRSGFVVRGCCIQAVGDFDAWVATKSPCRQRLVAHVEREHDGREIEEANLSRLWVLQEIILSDTIQFVSCDYSRDRRSTDSAESNEHIEELGVKLMSTWVAWFKYGNAGDRLRDASHLDFVRAFFSCGTVSRSSRAAHRPFLPDRWEFTMQLWSTHRTSKARDFVLAVMPQYSFYSLPAQARSMTFPELFADCFAQLEAKTAEPLWLAPGIPLELGIGVPTPACLGDFIKLCQGPRLKDGARGVGYRVRVQAADILSTKEVLEKIQSVVSSSELLWPAARRGELAETNISSAFDNHSESSNGLYLKRVLRHLSQKGASTQGDDMSTLDNGKSQPIAKDDLLLATALISCGIGLGALDWMRGFFSPALVHFEGMQFIALVPIASLKRDESGQEFYLEEGVKYFGGGGILDKKRFVLIERLDKGGQHEESRVTCLFPHDVDLFGWKVWRNWT